MNLLADIYVHSNRNHEGYHVEYKQMLFPDGQPHVTLLEEVRHERVTITARVKSGLDILELLLLKDVLSENRVSLDITYLLGARMDRRIDAVQPFTLKVIAKMLSSEFTKVRILDPHSAVSLALLNARPVYPIHTVGTLLSESRYTEAETVIVAPDAGATHRVEAILQGVGSTLPVVQGLKHRDPQSGKLSGFSVANPELLDGKRALILDDICDGGGTFTGLAHILKDKGAQTVDLFVTHGIFSKGTHLEGVDHIITTDSYFGWGQAPGFSVFTIDWLGAA